MADDDSPNPPTPPDRPAPPELPSYVLDPLERQSPERLDAIATYARDLAAWKRLKARDEPVDQAGEPVDEDELQGLEDRGLSTDPADYEAVPAQGAYVTVKETKPGYRYYYWQWRAGDTWKNAYIGPVDPPD
ncbi:hypothetical protein [Haloarchaeobius amylolyticus]|uniref:hypothetical protein n=1 Tax=Haloarchaeobius amylolyticus TaxID=1198296 RepID=UPI0022702CEB|nr:hypothetical protein [Haloarchaeobius amylolyticus]